MALMAVVVAQAAIANFVNFETAPVHPVALGPANTTVTTYTEAVPATEPHRFYRVRQER